jgi:DNA-binding transcriptional regulator YhcF (GntR family)
VVPEDNIITIETNSSKPKYEQIVDAIIHLIESGKLSQGTQLPSIAGLSAAQKLAKATVAKSYDALCERGIIISKHGKGFYVAKTSVKSDLNIFLLFDTFNQYKEILYYSLTQALPASTQYSIVFHHYNLDVFKSLIQNSIGKYTHYVVVPHFREDVSEIINLIPAEKLLVLDQRIKGLNAGESTIYQPFKKNIIDGLTQAKGLIKKYNNLHLILGKSHFQYVPAGTVTGFKSFAKKENISFTIDENLDLDNIRKKDAYLFFSDADMIRFVKHAELKKLKIGKDVGMISYDDTPLKEILLGGVSVISTDFENMGRMAAEVILNKDVVHLENPGGFIKRNTL